MEVNPPLAIFREGQETLYPDGDGGYATGLPIFDRLPSGQVVITGRVNPNHVSLSEDWRRTCKLLGTRVRGVGAVAARRPISVGQIARQRERHDAPRSTRGSSSDDDGSSESEPPGAERTGRNICEQPGCTAGISHLIARARGKRGRPPRYCEKHATAAARKGRSRKHTVERHDEPTPIDPGPYRVRDAWEFAELVERLGCRCDRPLDAIDWGTGDWTCLKCGRDVAPELAGRIHWKVEDKRRVQARQIRGGGPYRKLRRPPQRPRLTLSSPPSELPERARELVRAA